MKYYPLLILVLTNQLHAEESIKCPIEIKAPTSLILGKDKAKDVEEILRKKGYETKLIMPDFKTIKEDEIFDSQWRSLKSFEGAKAPTTETFESLNGKSRLSFSSFPGESCMGSSTTITINGFKNSSEVWSCSPYSNSYSFGAVQDSKFFVVGKSFSIGTKFEETKQEFKSQAEARTFLLKKFADSFPSCDQLREKLPNFAMKKSEEQKPEIEKVDLKVNDSAINIMKEKNDTTPVAPKKDNETINK